MARAGQGRWSPAPSSAEHSHIGGAESGEGMYPTPGEGSGLYPTLIFSFAAWPIFYIRTKTKLPGEQSLPDGITDVL